MFIGNVNEMLQLPIFCKFRIWTESNPSVLQRNWTRSAAYFTNSLHKRKINNFENYHELMIFKSALSRGTFEKKINSKVSFSNFLVKTFEADYADDNAKKKSWKSHKFISVSFIWQNSQKLFTRIVWMRTYIKDFHVTKKWMASLSESGFPPRAATKNLHVFRYIPRDVIRRQSVEWKTAKGKKESRERRGGIQLARVCSRVLPVCTEKIYITEEEGGREGSGTIRCAT